MTPENRTHLIKISGSRDAAEIRQKLLVHAGIPPEPYSGPISCNIRLGIPRAQALAYRNRRFPVGSPDAIAIATQALDAATGILWRSRSQIVGCDLSRHYVADAYIEFDFYEICTPEENHHAATTIARGRV